MIIIKNQTPFRNCKRETREVIENPKDCLMAEEKRIKNLKDDDIIIFDIEFSFYGVKEKRMITKKELYDQIKQFKAIRRMNNVVGDYVINLDRNNYKLVK
jgi:hypothetical protein